MFKSDFFFFIRLSRALRLGVREGNYTILPTSSCCSLLDQRSLFGQKKKAKRRRDKRANDEGKKRCVKKEDEKLWLTSLFSCLLEVPSVDKMSGGCCSIILKQMDDSSLTAWRHCRRYMRSFVERMWSKFFLSSFSSFSPEQFVGERISITCRECVGFR